MESGGLEEEAKDGFDRPANEFRRFVQFLGSRVVLLLIGTVLQVLQG